MNDRCAICGARLGENNTTGIGFECQAALDKAKENAFFKNEDYACLLYTSPSPRDRG